MLLGTGSDKDYDIKTGNNSMKEIIIYISQFYLMLYHQIKKIKTISKQNCRIQLKIQLF